MSQTVDRAFALLEQIAIEPQSIGMLAAHIGVHKSTALRLARTLENAGFVARRQDGRYTLGSLRPDDGRPGAGVVRRA